MNVGTVVVVVHAPNPVTTLTAKLALFGPTPAVTVAVLGNVV